MIPRKPPPGLLGYVPKKPRHPYPFPERLERKDPPMTIAAGFLCRDGIVICADSEVSTDLEKFEESKIFSLNAEQDSQHPTIIFAGSGWFDFVKMTVDKIQRRSLFAANRFEIEEIVENTVLEVNRKHIRYYPTDPKPFFNLLVGIRDESGLSLLLTAGTSVNRITQYACIGIGDTLANYLARGLTPQRETSQEAALLAVQILDQVKSNVPGCGGLFSEVVILPKQGAVSRIVPSKLIDIEYRARDFNILLKPLLMSFSNPTIPDNEFEAKLAEFNEQCRRVREEAKERLERARRRKV
jgi:20S proteasome alpha/beta subunit